SVLFWSFIPGPLLKPVMTWKNRSGICYRAYRATCTVIRIDNFSKNLQPSSPVGRKSLRRTDTFRFFTNSMVPSLAGLNIILDNLFSTYVNPIPFHLDTFRAL